MRKKEMTEIEKREIREDCAFSASCSEYLHILAARRLPWSDFKVEFAPVHLDTSDGSRPCAIVLAFAGTSDNCDLIVHAWANAVHEVMGMHLNDNDRRAK